MEDTNKKLYPKDFKIKPIHRRILRSYLKKFYRLFPEEKFTIFDMITAFRKRIDPRKNKKDAWAAVVGETGGGKSLMAIMILILFGRKASLKKNITYIPRGNEIIDKFENLQNNVLIIDEAAQEMRAVNWHSKQQQKVNVKAMTDRFYNNFVLMLIPNFNELTKSMRAGNILFRFIILYRNANYARVILQRKSKNFRNEDPWGDNAANKIYAALEKKRRDITDDKRLEIERKLPNYVLDFIVPNLEVILPELCETYREYKIQSRKVVEDKDELPAERLLEKYKEKYKNLLRKITKTLQNNTLGYGQVKVSKSSMCKELGVSAATFNKYLYEDVKEE